jgi:hypoxanthine phosphoribosyltransferase
LPTSGDVRIRTLFDAKVIGARNEALAQEIKAAALDRMLVVAVLKGSFIFAADLIRSLHAAGLAPEVEFVSLSSYREGTVSSGTVRILHDVESDVRGRDVLLVDDILESGRTLAYAKDLFAARGARRVLTCVLLEKPGKRAVSLDADFVGFRQLPFVGVVEK